MEKPKRLGRGLSAMLNDPVPVIVSEQLQTIEPLPQRRPEGLVQVPVGRIVPSRFQPRRVFDQVALDRLADSIRRSGMMQPVVLRPGQAAGEFELVAGERRWRAAQMAGLPAVPAVVHDLSDEDSAEWGVVENVQREDLNPIEKAMAFRALLERFGYTHGQIAERVGLDRSSVANMLRLLELEPQIQGMIEAGRLTAGHGRALLGAPSGAERLRLAEQASDEGWSVRRLERAAVAGAAGEVPAGPGGEFKREGSGSNEALAKAAARAELERQLGEFLGTKVAISTDRGGKRGRLSVEFYGLEHFDGLLHKLGFQMK
jgi:ParB family transcriptional regulator, chromosome partitioning protein